MAADEKATIAKIKRRLIRGIKARVTQHLRPSGYRKALDPKKGIFGGTRSWLVWCRPKGTAIYLGGIVIEAFDGLCEEGVVTEFGVGAAWLGYGTLPVEDLLKLKRWADREFPLEVR